MLERFKDILESFVVTSSDGLQTKRVQLLIAQEMTSPSSSGMRCSRQQLLQAACELVDDAQLWLEQLGQKDEERLRIGVEIRIMKD